MSYRELAEKYAKESPSLFSSPVIPFDPMNARNLVHFCTYAENPYQGGLQPCEYTGWRDEEVAWHKTCYIHTGLNPSPTYRFWGPDCTKFLKKYFANTFEDGFPVGKAKRGIMLDEEGRNMMDGMLLKTGENECTCYWLDPWVEYCVETCGMDVQGENLTEKVFLFQLGGPTSLQILEAASGENLHDIKFIHHRMAHIAGAEVRILRMGMAGSLGYEVHGNIEDSHKVWNRIWEAGKKYGLRHLGITAYNMTHWENGFPQAYIDFLFPWCENPDFYKWLKEKNKGMMICLGKEMPEVALSGSMGKDIYKRYRNPIELGWGKTVNYDHDFLGKEALMKIRDNNPRQMVTLEWNVDDIMEIHRNQLTPGEEPYLDISNPDDFSYGFPTYHADMVVNEKGEEIGISTGRMIAWFYRTMISISSIEPEYAKIGTEVYVVWGEPGTRQKKIRAKIARWPYFDTDRNQKVDVNKIPVGTMD